MKQIRIVLAIFAIIMAGRLFANPIDVTTARTLGQNFFYERVNQHKMMSLSDIVLGDVIIKSVSGVPLYYSFNIVSGGFIIIAADDAVYPIIGYAFDGSLGADATESCCFNWWMNKIVEQITYVRENNIPANSEIKQMWNFYTTASETSLQVLKSKDVLPLIIYNWDQGKYYNQLCPAASGGPDNKALVGCVATSMGEVMAYYRWPIVGNGTHSGINLGTTYYRWNEILPELANYNYGVAELLYHAGKTINMNYSATGSGANTSDVPAALESHFRFNTAANYSLKFGYGGDWATMLRDNLNVGHPIIYSGTDPANGGHAWVCDGYQGTNYFHMNWGWSGYANGYFYTDNLNPSGYNFSNWTGAAYNLYPAAGFPEYCTGTNAVTFSQGTISDGSGNNNYLNNSDCYWLIDPADSVDRINLTWLQYSTEGTNDVVTVYDGPTISDPVLGTYSGATLPSSVSSTGSKMLIRFTTNGSTTNTGWLVQYNCIYHKFCTSITTMTTPSGSFSDGSGSVNYGFDQLCRWRIQPTGAGAITLNFSAFNVATDDYLKVYDEVSGSEMASYAGSSIPGSQTYYTSKLLLTFKTNNMNNSYGFDANYTSWLAGVEDNSFGSSLSIFPNPCSGIFNISLNLDGSSALLISVMSISGETVFFQDYGNISGEFFRTIDLSGMAKGIYMLRVIGDSDISVRKIIIQ